MNIWPFGKHKQEVRADTSPGSVTTITPADTIESEALLTALLNKNVITRDTVLEIPAVQACLQLITGTVASLPICLYETDENGEIKKIEGDNRVRLLNDDTGDTLTATQFWRAIIEDYYLGRGGYAYLNRGIGAQIESIHYVDERHISYYVNVDPIFKDYRILVQGKQYEPYEFFKILRKTKDGWRSISVVDELATLLGTAYKTMVYEQNLVARGGNKRGFLQAENGLTESAFAKLKEAFRRVYSSSDENVVVLNKGVTFKEASNTSVEMQLAENKTLNGREICQIFGVPASLVYGGGTTAEGQRAGEDFIRTISALLNDIECSLDRDLLFEDEKGKRYFAFDTRELTRGDIKGRYEAYEIGIKNHFLQIDEVREMEDLEQLGFNWITLGLDSVLMDPSTKTIYTPNTNAVQNLSEEILGEGGEIDDESRNTS